MTHSMIIKASGAKIGEVSSWKPSSFVEPSSFVDLDLSLPGSLGPFEIIRHDMHFDIELTRYCIHDAALATAYAQAHVDEDAKTLDLEQGADGVYAVPEDE